MQAQWENLCRVRQELERYKQEVECKLSAHPHVPELQSAVETLTLCRRKIREVDDLIKDAAKHKRPSTRRREQIAEQLLTSLRAARVLLLQDEQKLQAHLKRHKDNLKASLRVARSALADHACDELEWGTSDQQRFEFFIRVAPTRRDEARRRFSERWPELKTEAPLLPGPSRSNRPLHARENRAESKDVPASDGAGQWQFSYRSERCNSLSPLPPDLEQARLLLNNLLAEDRLVADAEQVLGKLVAVTRVSKQERQQLPKVGRCEPRGWKIVHIGCHRALISISEDLRRITFLVRPRSRAYERAHH